MKLDHVSSFIVHGKVNVKALVHGPKNVIRVQDKVTLSSCGYRLKAA
jgi:hypothetical protein